MKKVSFSIKKVNLLVYSLFLLLLGLSFSTNPPNGNTGAPGDGLCTGCHSPNLSIDGNVTLTGLPAEVEPGQSYNITITSTYTQGNAVRAGFQLVALDGNNSNIGSFSNAGPNVDFESGGGRTYAEHRPAQFFGSGNAVDFTFTWTAPTQPTTENITFYVASLLANGSGSSGDRTVTNTAQTFIQTQQPDDLLLSLSSENASCFGFEDGSIASLVTGGVEPYSYLWSDGSSQPNLDQKAAGTYSLTVTDNNGTQVTGSETITEPEALGVVFNSSGSITCIQNNVTVSALASGGIGPYNYLWSDGSQGPELNTQSPGIYFLTLSDLNDCTEVFSTEVFEDIEILSIDLAPEIQQTCFEDTLEIQANAPTGSNYSYQWSTMDGNILSFDNLGAMTLNQKGTYTLRVTNVFNGCFAEAQVTVIGSDQGITINLSGTSPSCFGDSDGILQAEISGGTPPYAYAWSNGGNTPIIDNLSAGIYQLTLSDGLGCSQVQTIDLEERANLTLQFQIQDLTGPEENDASISAVVLGGTPPYSYQWEDPSSNNPTLQNLSPGTYTLTVTDSLSCSVSGNAVINPFGCDLQVSVMIQDSILCHADSNGSLMLSIEGENSPFQILWSTASDSIAITGLAAGLYSATVTDNVGCEKEVQFNLSQPNPLVINFQIQNTSAPGANDGALFANVAGGTPPYQFIWIDMGETSDSLTSLAPGIYPLRVVDSKGCSAEAEAEIKDFECQLEVAELLVQDVSCFGESDGKVQLILNTNEPSTTAIWSNGSQGLNQENLQAGQYTVTISDENQCQIEVEVTVDQPDELIAEIVDYSPVISTPFTGFIEIAVEGGTSPYTFQWSVDGQSLDQSDNLIQELNAGIYEVAIGDAQDCEFQLSNIEIELLITRLNSAINPDIPFLLYPNPAEEFMALQITKPLGKKKDILLQIVNEKGSIVWTQKTEISDKLSMDIGQLPKGQYLLVIYLEGQWQNALKWIKN
jgi:hypothetical protein